eukprot:3723272-Amphidinium_carterae.1
MVAVLNSEVLTLLNFMFVSACMASDTCAHCHIHMIAMSIPVHTFAKLLQQKEAAQSKDERSRSWRVVCQLPSSLARLHY